MNRALKAAGLAPVGLVAAALITAGKCGTGHTPAPTPTPTPIACETKIILNPVCHPTGSHPPLNTSSPSTSAATTSGSASAVSCTPSTQHSYSTPPTKPRTTTPVSSSSTPAPSSSPASTAPVQSVPVGTPSGGVGTATTVAAPEPPAPTPNSNEALANTAAIDVALWTGYALLMLAVGGLAIMAGKWLSARLRRGN